jgi:hypothetical protein
MESNRGTTEEDIVGAAVLEEQLNILREDCDNITQEKGSLTQKAQHIGTDREATEEDVDKDELLVEQFNIVSQD